MGTSSLLGIDRPQPTAPGRDTDTLGPSDSSDSGSDVQGLNEPDDGGLEAPLDKATRAEIERSDTSVETIASGVDSDSHASGERRSAAGDRGEREALDISPDRIVGNPDGGDVVDDADLDALAATAAIDAAEDEEDDEDDEDEEDEDADPVGDPDRPPTVATQRDVNDEGDDLVLVPPR